MRQLVLAGAIAATLAGTGCAGKARPAGPPRPAIVTPVVSLVDVRPAGVGLTGGALDVVLSVYNPNQFELHSPRVNYRLLVGDVRLADGDMSSDLVVPALDSVQVVLPAKFSYVAIGRAGREMLGTGTVDYRVLGDIDVGTQYGRYSVPYDRTGRFSSLTAMRIR